MLLLSKQDFIEYKVDVDVQYTQVFTCGYFSLSCL